MAFFAKSTSISLVLAAILLLALTAAHIEGSTLTVFAGPGCSGNLEMLSCGNCHENVRYKSGYYFLYTGGTAWLYSDASCSGLPGEPLTDDQWMCSGFAWKSVNISCSVSSMSRAE